MDGNTTIDIEEVSDIGEPIYEDHEIIEEIPEDEYQLQIIDYSQTLTEMNQERITIPYLTKYERTQLISARAQQLSMGAIPTVDTQGLNNTVDIADKELKERKIPLIIRRILPNKQYEDWKIEELLIN